VNYIRHLNAFFTFIKKDDNLTSSHVSLYLALFQYWNFNRFQNPFPIYRDDIMQLSKIGSKNTYHKCLKELHLAHYIIYHTKISKYQAVKISMLRLDIKQETTAYKQLEIFNSNPPSPTGEGPGVSCPNIGTTSVPILTFTCPKYEPLPVPFLGHLIKHINFNKTGKGAHAQNFLKNPGEKEAGKQPARIPNLGYSTERGGSPTLSEVEKFFRARNYPSTEAKKFFNHYKAIGWKIQGVTPIEDWGALADKWMENAKQWASNTKSAKPVMEEDERTLQYLYERFLEGRQVFKFILPDHFDQLHLQLNETDMAEARKERINQVSQTNNHSLNQIWQAYLTGDPQNELLKKDEPNLLALAKRLAVLNHFKEQQQTGITSLSS
jgi:hypothetical protein